jgi:hypothetical protein
LAFLVDALVLRIIFLHATATLKAEIDHASRATISVCINGNTACGTLFGFSKAAILLAALLIFLHSCAPLRWRVSLSLRRSLCRASGQLSSILRFADLLDTAMT